ncbi:MAG: M43 family zinc metalloprotease [Bacteroidota bacterium]
MRKTTIILLLCLMLAVLTDAQQIQRCSSAEYLKALELNDPAFAQRRIQSEAASQQWIASHQGNMPRSIITIPVVFHLLYNDSTQMLDDSVVQSQMDVINEDYRRQNPDAGQTPLAFRAVAADCEIEFCFAKRTPDGLPTNGIIRKYTSVSQFSDYSGPKLNSTNGDNAWDASRYLNVWVAAFVNPNFLGLGTFPDGDTTYDGVVVNYKAFGRIGTHLMAHYNEGRSLTHEIGHWLNLKHVWADDGNTCDDDDDVADTPLQRGENYGCPSYPKTDLCSPSFPGIMFMNYLDYTDDACMNIFTEGQKARMLAALNLQRTSILSSNGCTTVGIEENELKNFISVFPNPVENQLTVDIRLLRIKSISIYNLLGESVLTNVANYDKSQQSFQIDVISLSPGIYFLQVVTEEGKVDFKIVKTAAK